MPRRVAAACGIGLLWLCLARVAGAQPADAPPDQLPERASFAVGAISYPVGQVAYPVGTVSFTNGVVAASEGAIATPGADLAAGQMSVKEEKGGLRFTLNADLLFDFDKADLRAEADPVLSALVAQVGARMPGGRFRVEGHTDAKGNDKYNDALSTRRAKSVQSWLTRRGDVAATRIATAGLGKRRPVAPNQKPDGSDDPEGRQKNRRVEILVLPKG